MDHKHFKTTLNVHCQLYKHKAKNFDNFQFFSASGSRRFSSVTKMAVSINRLFLKPYRASCGINTIIE